MQDALKAAIEVPLSVVQVGNSCWPHLITLAQYGNISTKSDLQVTVVYSKCARITHLRIHPLHPCTIHSVVVVETEWLGIGVMVLSSALAPWILCTR